MSLANPPLSYSTLTEVLTQQGVGMTPAEMHGLISGLLCGGTKDHSWKSRVHELTNEGIAFTAQLNQRLQHLHAEIQTSLEDRGFNFQLLLPEENIHSVFERADGLAGWVNHFLLGLGVTQPKLDKVTGEAGEAIDELRTIAQLGYDQEEDQEELEQSLEEVIEYVRVAAVLCFETFNSSQPLPVIKETPTLH